MSGPGSRKTSGIEDTIQEFWADRPVRPRHGGKLAGVSAAIGNRYGIDPVLVRVAFVVGAFYGGAGIVLYLLGWLMLPKEGSGRPGESGSRTASIPMLVVLALLLVPALFAVTDFAGLLGLALGVGALYLLHRNYRDRTPISASPVAGDQHPPEVRPTPGAQDEHTWVYPGTSTATPGRGSEPPPTAQQEEENTQPPSWDPLGAAPFAWDLPEPGEPPHEPEPSRPRRSITLVTLALALIAGGLTVPSASLTTAGVAALSVIGTGMIIGAFLNGGRGLIGAAIPIAALTLLASALPEGYWRGFSSVEAHPTSIGAVRDTYSTSVGNIDLHLDELRIPENKTVHSSAEVGLGSISVHLPPDVDATVRCSADMGSLACLGEQRGGSDIRTETTDFGADGPGGGNIVLDLTASTGSVEVTRG